MKRAKFQEQKRLLAGPLQRDTLIKFIGTLPLDADNPLEIVIRERQKVRGLDANARYWAGPLKDIADQAWLDGRQFSAEVWAHYFKKELLPEDDEMPVEQGLAKDGYIKWQYGPDGERVLVGSTTQLTVRGFAIYTQQVEAFGANLGVMFSASPLER